MDCPFLPPPRSVAPGPSVFLLQQPAATGSAVWGSPFPVVLWVPSMAWAGGAPDRSLVLLPHLGGRVNTHWIPPSALPGQEATCLTRDICTCHGCQGRRCTQQGSGCHPFSFQRLQALPLVSQPPRAGDGEVRCLPYSEAVCEPGFPTPGSFCWVLSSPAMLTMSPVWLLLHPWCWELRGSPQSAKPCLLVWDTCLHYFLLCFPSPFWTYD
ncbi:hypothetical protein HJG60_010363 [Phyllostomus discolor]|uniref:Uncharacterized protein n=1 Tax=Phyllostomus discolor TaxID=89673 RepID=A0A834EMX1_9CHIR|nr:hypothetical protein HJG60_010363 [Phyllostomus discolor]